MSNTVAIRWRRPLPGQGYNANGRPVFGKTEVHGRITVTSFAAGESLTPSDLGLEVIDDIQMNVTEAVGSKSGRPRTCEYSYSAQEFYVFEDAGTAQTVGNDYVVGFIAFGDSATAPVAV